MSNIKRKVKSNLEKGVIKATHNASAKTRCSCCKRMTTFYRDKLTNEYKCIQCNNVFVPEPKYKERKKIKKGR